MFLPKVTYILKLNFIVQMIEVKFIVLNERVIFNWRPVYRFEVTLLFSPKCRPHVAESQSRLMSA